MFARYAPTGHLVYARAGALFAVPFDLTRLEVTGTPTQVLDGVVTVSDERTGAVCLLARWIAGVRAGRRRRNYDSTLRWVDRQRKNAAHHQPPGRISGTPPLARWSAGGRRHRARRTTRSGSYDVARDTFSRLVFGWNNSWPVWTPDGSRIAFQSDRAGVIQPVLATGGREWSSRATHDQCARAGSLVLVARRHRSWPSPNWIRRPASTSGPFGWTAIDKPRPFLREAFEEQVPAFSPDGRWLAYRSDETGRDEIYVRPYPGPGGKWQISNDGGDVAEVGSEWARIVLSKRRQARQADERSRSRSERRSARRNRDCSFNRSRDLVV